MSIFGTGTLEAHGQAGRPVLDFVVVRAGAGDDAYADGDKSVPNWRPVTGLGLGTGMLVWFCGLQTRRQSSGRRGSIAAAESMSQQ